MKRDLGTMTGGKASKSRDTAILYGYVIAGSVLGGVARYLLSLVIHSGAEFPWATLFVNVTGSFIIGFYSTLSGPDGRLFASARQRQFVMTGFCGGYTTFSAFSLETFRLLQAGMARTALAYVAISVVTWLVAVWFGYMLANRLNRLKGS
jgi:CrcB protein